MKDYPMTEREIVDALSILADLPAGRVGWRTDQRGITGGDHFAPGYERLQRVAGWLGSANVVAVWYRNGAQPCVYLKGEAASVGTPFTGPGSSRPEPVLLWTYRLGHDPVTALCHACLIDVATPDIRGQGWAMNPNDPFSTADQWRRVNNHVRLVARRLVGSSTCTRCSATPYPMRACPDNLLATYCTTHHTERYADPSYLREQAGGRVGRGVGWDC